MTTIMDSILTGGNFVFCWDFLTLSPAMLFFVQKYQKYQIYLI